MTGIDISAYIGHALMSYIWQEKVKATVVGSFGFELEVVLPGKQMYMD